MSENLPFQANNPHIGCNSIAQNVHHTGYRLDSTRAPSGYDPVALRERVYFEFHTSQDEEHTFILAHMNCTGVDLGERVHHYLLLLLARQRLNDADKGFDSSNQGWVRVERLSVMLGLCESYVNLQIHRARKQLARFAGSDEGAAQLIERRAGEVRFGYANYRIKKAGKLEGQLSA